MFLIILIVWENGDGGEEYTMVESIDNVHMLTCMVVVVRQKKKELGWVESK